MNYTIDVGKEGREVCRKSIEDDQLDKAFNKMEKIGLNEKQHTVADRALSAVNHCGAVYGAIAYRLGLQDGIKIASELRELE